MKRKRTVYIIILSVLILLFSGWQYQKYINNKISLSEILSEIEDNLKKEDSEIYKILVNDIAENKSYNILNIEEFTSIFNNLEGTILNTNKKGIIKTDYDYGVLIYYGNRVSDSDEYRENGRIAMDIKIEEKDALRLLVFDGVSKIDLNGLLEKESSSFSNPLYDYIIEGISNKDFPENLD